MKLKASDAFLVKASFSEIHTKLKAIKKSLLKKEDEEFFIKSAASLASFLDFETYNSKAPTLKETQEWLANLDEEAAEKEITDVQAWIHPLGDEDFLVKFFNLRIEHNKVVESKLQGQDFSFISGKEKAIHLDEAECKNREKVWLSVMGNSPSWKKVGFLFNLYQPSPLTLETLFKKMPSLKDRQKRLAEELIGDEWLTQYPEDECQNFIFSMVEYLRSKEGQERVEERIKEIKKIKLITKVKELI